MAAAVTRPAPAPQYAHRDSQQAAWQPAAPQRQGRGWQAPCATVASRLTIRLPPPCATAAAAAAASPAADLATYSFVRRSAGTTSEWFQTAIREVVKHINDAPILQTVQLQGNNKPRCSTYSVHESVVAVPELWQSIAQHLSQEAPDVVVMVQRVSTSAQGGSPQGAMDAVASQQQQGQQQPLSRADSLGAPGSPRTRAAGSLEMRTHAEEVCSRLVASGVADAILLHGQVGDCCDGSEPHAHDSSSDGSRGMFGSARAAAGMAPSIVPFSPPGRRAAVRAAALQPVSGEGASASAQQETAFWGVVVQSKRGTGAEGCYLLKTVRNTTPSTGCTCTHFSLTRITQGKNLEQQFVQSWLI